MALINIATAVPGQYSSLAAQTTYSSYVVGNVCDVDPTSFWQSNGLPSWLEYGFLGPRQITSIAITTRNDVYPDSGPGDFTVLGSTTGAFGGEEITLLTVTGATWTLGQRQVWSLSQTGLYSYYRINITKRQMDYAGYACTAKLELLIDENDSSIGLPYDSYTDDVSSGGTATASTVYSDNTFFYGPANAIDDNTSTSWISKNETISDQWWQVQFVTGYICNKITFLNRLAPEGPSEFYIVASDTGAFAGEEATLLHGYSRNWNNNEKRAFTWTNTTAYVYYRIKWVTNGGGGAAAAISEIEWMGFTDPPAKAVNPTPADDSVGIVVTTDCAWEDGTGSLPATSYDVYWGNSPGTLELVSPNQPGVSYDPGALEYEHTYYWRVDSINSYGTTTGDVWSFTTGTDTAPVTPYTPPFFVTYPPLWPMSEFLIWNTGVLKGADGSQQRIARRKPPAQQFIQTLYCQNEAETERCLAMIHGWAKLEWAIPVWPEAEWHTGALSAGATTITINTQYADYRDAGLAIVYYSPTLEEIVTTTTVAAGSLTLDSGLVNSYPNGAMVMPCRRGYLLDVATRKRKATGGSEVTMTYGVTDVIDITGYSAALSYDGYEVLTTPSRLIDEEWQEIHNPDSTTIDAGIGTFSAVSVSTFNIVIQDHIFESYTKAQAWSFRQWLHSIAGRQKTFLVPTFRPNFTLTRSVGASDTDIYVANEGRAQYMGVNALRTYLAFMPTGATIIPRKITAMGLISANEEKITLNTAPGVTFAAGEGLCWVDRVTLADDRMEIQWLEHDHNICETRLERVAQ